MGGAGCLGEAAFGFVGEVNGGGGLLLGSGEMISDKTHCNNVFGCHAYQTIPLEEEAAVVDYQLI